MKKMSKPFLSDNAKQKIYLFFTTTLRKYVMLYIVVGLTLASFTFIGSAAAKAMARESPQVVYVDVKEYTVDLSTNNLPADTPVTFVVRSHGTVTHEVVLEHAGDVDKPLTIDGEGAEIEDVNPGESKSATWVIGQPGEYQLACHVAGHFEGGMVNMFSVNPSGLAGMMGRSNFWIGFGGLTLLVALVIGWLGSSIARLTARKNTPMAS